MSYNRDNYGDKKKKFVTVEVKKRFNIFDQQQRRVKTELKPKEGVPENIKKEDNVDVAQKLSQSKEMFRKALFFGDRNLVNKIRNERIEYKKSLLLNSKSKTDGLKKPADGQKLYFKRAPLAPTYVPSPVISKPLKSKAKKDFNKKNSSAVVAKPKVEDLSVRFSNNMLGSIESAEDLNLDRDSTRSIASINRAKEKSRKVARSILPKDIQINSEIQLKELAANMSVTVSEVVNKLKDVNLHTNTETILNAEVTKFLVKEFGHRPKIKESILEKIKLACTTGGKDLRAPVVAVVGHVDHGKTSLLDALRKTNFTAKESGGITQSIGASQVYLDNNFVTFIDTPGHKLFANMRVKGMNLTDIILIVIAVDDGLKEQSIESIKYAQSTNCSLIVVFTKLDKARPGDIDKIKKALITHGIIVESLGGTVPDIAVSSKTAENLKELLELIILTGQMLELQADESIPGYGKVIDSYLDKHKGPVANIIIQNGTVKKGQYFLSGKTTGKVKSITDWRGKALNEAKPTFPVQISGFESIVDANEDFITMKQHEAKEAVAARNKLTETSKEVKINFYSADDIWRKLIGEQDVEEIKFIIRANSEAASEALVNAITVTDSNKINRTVISAGAGFVSEGDLKLAKASEARIIAFEVDVSQPILKLSQLMGVKLQSYSIIYNILEDIEQEIEDMFAPKESVAEIGKAEIRKVFMKPKPIAGCIVLDGVIKRNQLAAVFRDNQEMFRGKILSMRQLQNDIKEAKNGQECGIFIQGFESYEVGDIIKCFETTILKQ